MVRTNFEIIKELLPDIAKARLPTSAYSVFLYLIWQQFGFPNKDGDNIGYGRLSRELGFSRVTIIATIRNLIERNMLRKDLNRSRYGNNYHVEIDKTK
ncbi:hypothetical protein ACFLVH_03520 [Chloroflexota bacterium]